MGARGRFFYREKMEKTLKGKKQNMTQVFTDNGKVIPVTVIRFETELDSDLKDKKIEIIGKSKGKGFAGGMKKWGFRGGQRTHGQSNKPRAPGSIGSQTPGRVFKGKKMAGRLGGERVTVKGLRIVEIIKANNELLVSGPVPGARNSLVSIKVLE